MIKTLANLLINDFSWAMLPPFLKKNPKVEFQRKQFLIRSDKKAIENFFISGIIKDGIFKGLKYPSLTSFGSALYPKLIGSYEQEIQMELKQLLENNNYDTLIDFGCAEGYYLAGIGVNKPNIKLRGVDLSTTALDLTKQMLLNNGIIEERYVLSQNFDFNLFNENQKFLLISDCEGYEVELIDKINKLNISKIDFVIECHDFIIPNVTEILVSKLKNTHRIKIIKSTLDTHKLSFIPTELRLRAETDRLVLVAEGRPVIMNWIIAEALS